MKNKKILMLALVSGIVYSTTSNAFIKTEAGLTPPSSYDLYYAPYYDGGFVAWMGGRGAVGSGTNITDRYTDPTYTRTSSGSYYNYFTTWGTTGDNYPWIPNGLQITMTFNRSNVGNWVDSSGWYPEHDVIGSDNTVGSIEKKFYIKFDNQTNKDFYLYFDFFSTTSGTVNGAFYMNGYLVKALGPSILTGSFRAVYLPAYSNLEHYTESTSSAFYFNAWYLQDLGVSASYEAGYDGGLIDGYDDGLIDGYDDGFDDGVDVGQTNAVLSGGIGSIFTSAFTGIAGVFNIQAFGEITLGQLALAPIALGLLFILLNLVSGQISYNAGVTEAKRNQGRRDSRYRR